MYIIFPCFGKYTCGKHVYTSGKHVYTSRKHVYTCGKHVYHLGWNRSPAQAGCMRQVLGPGALGRPRGIGWRERWEGGSGWGIHVNPWLIHVNVWQKPLQYCKVISLQLIKINGKKKTPCTVAKEVVTWPAVCVWESPWVSEERWCSLVPQERVAWNPPPPWGFEGGQGCLRPTHLEKMDSPVPPHCL